LTNEADVVAQIEKILADLVGNRERLAELRERGTDYALQRLSWVAKAETITQIVQWAMGQGSKPVLPPPKVLAPDTGLPADRTISHSPASG
jgi:hypothetical protein